MPQLIFKGLKEDEVILLSKTLSDDLAKTTDTPNDWFLFEHIERKCYVLGERLTGDIHVDVWWFDRGQEIRDKVALSIDTCSINVFNKKGFLLFPECSFGNIV